MKGSEKRLGFKKTHGPSAVYENAGDTLKFASKSFIDSEVKRIQTGKMTSLEKINSIISEMGD